MAEALYGAGGYFTGDLLRSEKAGDFLTSPEVSSMFGETLAEFVRREHARIGDPFEVIEVAGGSGSLLRPLLESAPYPVRAVEASPAARRELAAVIGPDRVFEDMVSLGEVRGVILANELIDNLPMAIAQLTDAGWRERWVGVDGSDLVFVDAPCRPDVSAWLEAYAGDVEPGGWVEIQLAAAQWLMEVLGMLQAGAIVLIDYGDVAENLVPRRRDGTLRTYRAHHLGPHPFDEPGATDITADVNFTALVMTAEHAGASVELWRQDDFLADLGLRERLTALRTRELDLARVGPEVERLRVRTLKTEAETLMHPRGLGDFRVLVARKG